MRGRFGGGRGVFPLFVFWILAATASAGEYLALSAVAEDLGLEAVRLDEEGIPAVALRGKWISLRFRENSRIVALNGIKVLLGDPVVGSKGRLYLSRDDWKGTLRPILQPRFYGKPPGAVRVVVDPGHGGKDPGAQNLAAGLDEKDLAIDLARRVAEKLRRAGFEVALTRSDDRFVPLAGRPEAARRAGADLFLSLHFNAARPAVRGIETFVYTLAGDPSTGRLETGPRDRIAYPGNRNDPWNALLGYYLQAELVRATGLPDRGLKRARFAVLESLECPGALLELGFLSNRATAVRLKDPAWRDLLAEAVVRGVERYRKTLRRLAGPPKNEAGP